MLHYILYFHTTGFIYTIILLFVCLSGYTIEGFRSDRHQTLTTGTGTQEVENKIKRCSYSVKYYVREMDFSANFDKLLLIFILPASRSDRSGGVGN